MKLVRTIIILILLTASAWFKPCAAQKEAASVSEVEQVKAELLEKVFENRKKQEYKPKWQEDFEVMQLQANDSLARNIKLDIEYRVLEKQELELEDKAQTLQNKNQEFRRKIDEQQEMFDEKRWKAKTASQERQSQETIANKNKELENYDRGLKSLEQKIEVARLKLKMMGVEDYSDKLLAMQQERDILEANLASQKDKEKILTSKIQEFKDNRKILDPAVADMKSQIDGLRKEIADLQLQKSGLSGTSGTTLQEQIKILNEQKSNILTENAILKAKIDKYMNSQKMGIENKRTKDLIEQMSAVDTVNGELNDEIKYLTENIAILKARIKKLEDESDQIKANKSP